MKITAYPNRYVVSVPLDEMEAVRVMFDLALRAIKRDSDIRKSLRQPLTSGEKKAMSMWVGQNPFRQIDRDETDYRQDKK